MTVQDKKHDINFWDKAVRLYQSTEISLSTFCDRNNIEQEQFERMVKIFCYTGCFDISGGICHPKHSI